MNEYLAKADDALAHMSPYPRDPDGASVAVAAAQVAATQAVAIAIERLAQAVEALASDR
jgi:hypothetical protein